jgi:acetate kinase
LLGISELSGDMREVTIAMHEGNQRARLAFDMFVHRLRSGIGSMIAALNEVDAIVFTGGIGENSAEVREAASKSFAFLGLGIDARKNAAVQPDQDIATVESKVRSLVVRAQEDWAIARECWKLRSQSVTAA